MRADKFAECFVLVFELALLVLALNNDACFKVREPHGGGGLIDVLTAGTARAERVEPVVVGLEIDLDFFRFGQHGDGGGRGVDAALGFGIRARAARDGRRFRIAIRGSCPRLRSPSPYL